MFKSIRGNRYDTSYIIKSVGGSELSANINAEVPRYAGAHTETEIILNTDADKGNVFEFEQISDGVLRIHSYGNMERRALANVFRAIAIALDECENSGLKNRKTFLEV